MNIAKLQQGCILNDDDACKLCLVNSNEQVVVIISHDCDLASESDENIEVIIGTIKERLNPQFENSRHPRYLHLDFCKENGVDLCIELKHADKQQVSKKKIRELEYLSDPYLLTPEKKQVLKQWLGARYARPAFPNEFERRLRKNVNKKNDIIKAIEKIMESVSPHLLALFFDLGEDMWVELSEKQPYFLSIWIVYDTREGGSDAREHAESVAKKLKNLFIERYGQPDSAIDIVLEECVAIGDTEMRLADLRKVYQWRLEHLSFQDDPPSSLMMSGSLPV